MTVANFPFSDCIRHVTVSGTQDAANEHTIVPNVQRDIGSDVANSPNIVSGMHRNRLKSREGAGGQHRVVGTTYALPVIE